MLCADGKSLGPSVMMRRLISDAKSKFDGADISKMHHLAYVDMSKFGRLAAPDIDACAKWTHKVLSLNDDFRHFELF